MRLHNWLFALKMQTNCHFVFDLIWGDWKYEHEKKVTWLHLPDWDIIIYCGRKQCKEKSQLIVNFRCHFGIITVRHLYHRDICSIAPLKWNHLKKNYTVNSQQSSILLLLHIKFEIYEKIWRILHGFLVYLVTISKNNGEYFNLRFLLFFKHIFLLINGWIWKNVF